MAELRKIAGIQTDVRLGEPESNLNRMHEWLAQEGVRDSSLVVFPECALSGYCYDSLDEAWPHAQEIPGPATESIAQHCRESSQFVAFGMLERGGEGEIYNSCVLLGPDGIVGVYRKIHLPYLGVDRFVTQGKDPYRVYDLGGMKVGMHICYDGSFPEASRALALGGADLLILPTNWPPGADTFARYIPNARALENNVYFLAVNRAGIERGFRFIGQSRLCDTNGNSMADGPENGEIALIGTIDLAKARNKRLVRVPGRHVIDRFADRCPSYYGSLCENHSLKRIVE